MAEKVFSVVRGTRSWPPGAPGHEERRAAAVLSGLTEAQRAAVLADGQPLCVLAGAGSGKTTVLTRRVACRVLDGSADAAHTLVVTFTRKAAGELRERLVRLGVDGRVGTGTFHAVAYAQLRRHWADRRMCPASVLEDPARLLRAVTSAYDHVSGGDLVALWGEVHWAQVRMVGPEHYVADARRAGRPPAGRWSSADVADAYRAYVAAKAARGVIDLDDLVSACAEVLENDPVAAAAQRWRVRHLFVDEFQDVNPAQWRLLSAWLGEGGDLFVVGDPRQAIYSWNGADPTLLDRLPDLLPGTSVLRLDDNHRSTPQVVRAARAVLEGSPRTSDTVGATRPDGPNPVVGGYDDDEAEAAAVVRWLRLARGPGRSWSGLAVVARTNARLDPVARALARAGIPVRRGRPETPGTLPGRGAPGTALWHLRRAPRQDSLRSVLAELVTSPQDAVAGGAHLAELAPTLARLADEQALDLPGATVGEFLDWLAGTGGTTELETPALDAVELSTFHRAKGLEWPAVAVVGLEDGMVPIAYATSADALAEERRLLYVALTRAQDELWCSWARRRSAGDRSWSCEASPLLAAVEAAACAEEPDTSPAALAARFASLRARLPAAG